MTYNKPRDTYFETQVLTATPQKLQLMLLEGALRYGRQAADHWREGRIYEGGEAVIGCQRIVTELLRALKPELAPALVENVSSVYRFVFRTLVEAGMKRDAGKLAEAMRLLEIERETWRQVCERLATQGNVPAPHGLLIPPVSSGFALEA
ncbi:MAG TPA: flagellar export chaperone FliS [Pirellulales bacterium]|nr:flagellar export chaperone FliS [Pirellulales bacterium]